jgi:uncharacterized protein (DUF302 family)/uncharacterized membrane protein YidH (DUF202 family)
MADSTKASASDYLAAERTFLAWIRTGLAMMGFGFVVARFGLFLQALLLNSTNRQIRPNGPSFWIGTALVVLGVAVNVVSARNHARLVDGLNRGEADFKPSFVLAVTLALILAAFGLVMAAYLFTVRQPEDGTLKQRRETSMNTDSSNGIVNVASRHSVDETVERFKSLLESKGVKLFALIDHSGEAEKAGLHMPPTKLLIFGNPKGGTPLMIAAPSIAIDLPLKALVWEDPSGKVWISYNEASYLQARHQLPPELSGPLGAAKALSSQAAE